MNYFSYVKDHGAIKTMEIYKAVYSLKAYAVSIYKNLWEDALDKSFFHVLENYNEDCGCELSHYATRIVGTILLNKYKHEIEHETSLSTAMDKKSQETQGMDPLNILLGKESNSNKEVSTHVEECKNYLLPMSILDYRFFKSRKAGDRKLSYEGLFQKYSARAISTAMNLLVEEYGSELEELYELKKSCRYRNFSEERYIDSLDTTLEYETTFNGIVLYKRLAGKSRKYFHLINLKESIDRIIDVFYKDMYVRTIGGQVVYCTLSGNLVLTIEELRYCLENEVLGALLSRYKLKVLMYERGINAILTSSKELEDVVLNIMDLNFNIPLKRLVSKCIGKS